MFLLPIGLQARRFRIPWGTLFLVFSSLVLSSNQIWYHFEFENYFKFQDIIFQSLTSYTPAHMITMLFILLAFSTYVEMRFGFFVYLLIYFSSAFFASFLRPVFEISDPQFIAHFSLSCLAGSFLVFFMKTPYRLLFFSAPKTKKIVLAPSWMMLLLAHSLFIAITITQHHSFPLNSLLGYALGVIFALLWKEMSFLKKGTLFPIEVTYLLKAKKETDPLKKIDWILECLKVNPANPQAVEYLFLSIAKSKVPSHFFTEDQKDIIAELVSSIIKRTVKIEMNLVIYYFSLLPLNWNLADIGLVDIVEDDLDYMNDLLDVSEWRIAIRLYDAYLAKDADEEVRAIVIANIQTTLNELARIGLKPQDREWLSEYILYHSDGYASNLIKATIDLSGSDSGEKAS